MSDQITVIAFPTAQLGKEGEFVERFTALMEATRQEPGCLDFHFHRHADAQNRFVVYENFLDQSAFDEHLNAEHTQAFIHYLTESGGTLTYEFWTMLSPRQDGDVRDLTAAE